VTAPGLCGRCRYARVVQSRRGSTFYLCGRARTDPRFPRYPVLPVLRCAGFETDPGAGAEGGAAPVTNDQEECQ
jgi:hypothetical protein